MFTYLSLSLTPHSSLSLSVFSTKRLFTLLCNYLRPLSSFFPISLCCSFYLSVYLSVSLTICTTVLTFSPSLPSLSSCLSPHPSSCLTMCLSSLPLLLSSSLSPLFCLSISLPLHPYLSLSVFLSLLSIHPPVYLSTHL